MDGANYKRALVRAAPVHMFMVLSGRDELIQRARVYFEFSRRGKLDGNAPC